MAGVGGEEFNAFVDLFEEALGVGGLALALAAGEGALSVGQKLVEGLLRGGCQTKVKDMRQSLMREASLAVAARLGDLARRR